MKNIGYYSARYNTATVAPSMLHGYMLSGILLTLPAVLYHAHNDLEIIHLIDLGC